MDQGGMPGGCWERYPDHPPNYAAKAITALEGRMEVTVDDIRQVIVMCLRPRLRKDPLESIDSGSKVVKVFLRVFGLES